MGDNVRDKVKGILDKGKQKWKALAKRTKIALCAVLGVAVLAIAVVLIIQATRPYVTLFTGLNSTDMADVVTYFSENGITDYRISGEDTILVPESQEPQLRAALLMSDYPTSGFSYSTYLDNVGSLTTESEREQLALMEAQDRLAATIRCLDGVQNAVVDIEPAVDNTYVLDSTDARPASASVMVTMRGGQMLSDNMVAAIQTLLRTSIQGLEIENIGIVDSLGNAYTAGTIDGVEDASQLKLRLEEQQNNLTRTNIMQILVPLFGEENVKVSVRTTVNVDRSVTDATDYSMEEGAEGNRGLVASESYDNGIVRGDNGGAGGVAGTTTNADLNTYVTQEIQPDGTEEAITTSGATDYLYDQENTQTEHNSGVITDMMVAVTINASAVGNVNINSLVSHVARAAGISPDLEDDKISILTEPFYTENLPPVEIPGIPDLVLYAALGGLGVFLLLLLVILLIRRRRRRRRAAEEAAARPIVEMAAPPPSSGEGADIMSVDTEKSMELRKEVRKFAESSPEIAAQMVRNWLRDGGDQS